jgi:hypothetical protein
VGGAVFVGALELQHDIAVVVDGEPFIGDGGAAAGMNPNYSTHSRNTVIMRDLTPYL